VDRRAGVDRRSTERLKLIREEIDREIEINTFKLNLYLYENRNVDKPTILIVEDTPGQLNLLIESLKDEYNLLFAQNGLMGSKN